MVNLSFPDADDYDQLGFSYSKPIRHDGRSVGSHVNLQPTIDRLKDEPRLMINLTARTGTLLNPSRETALSFLDVAHTVLNETFSDLLSDSVKSIWGMSE